MEDDKMEDKELEKWLRSRMKILAKDIFGLNKARQDELLRQRSKSARLDRLYRLRKQIYIKKGKLMMICNILNKNYLEVLKMTRDKREGRQCEKCNLTFEWFCFRDATEKEIESMPEWDEMGVPYIPKTDEDFENSTLCISNEEAYDLADNYEWAEKPCKECIAFMKRNGVNLENKID
jgi:hypothetical protein